MLNLFNWIHLFIASQEENMGSPPPLLWCGQSTSESGHDGSFFGAENLVECELRAPSPHEAPAEVSGTFQGPMSLVITRMVKDPITERLKKVP
jgi:hypothetical protein